MNKLKLFFFLVGFFIVSCAVGDVVEIKNDSNSEFSVFAEIEKNSVGDYFLAFNLVNNSRKNIEFNLDSLERSQLVIALVKDNALNEPLREKFFLLSPLAGSFTLDSNKKHEVKIPLSNSFPGLKKALLKNNVIVFWYVEIDPEGSIRSQDFGGYLKISKK